MTPDPAYFLPDATRLQSSLRTRLPHFPHIRWVSETDSTNAQLLKMARQDSGPSLRPWLLGAHLQSEGRGRAGRQWQNQSGSHLMLSCAFDIFLPTRQLATLSPLIGMASCEALRSLLDPKQQHKLTMKWPNDVLWEGKKLAGILVETTKASTSPASPDHHVVIIGIGLNLQDGATLSQHLNRPIADWGMLAMESERAAHATCADIVTQLAQSYYLSLNHVTAKGFADLPERYRKVDHLLGQHIHIIHNDQVLHTGIAQGINEAGFLLLRHPSGEELAVSVGEVSVRPQR